MVMKFMPESFKMEEVREFTININIHFYDPFIFLECVP